MNYMKQIAKMLGVELGEKFKIQAGKILVNEELFVITEGGIRDMDGTSRNDGILPNLLMGVFTVKKFPWKPKNGEAYYYIDTDDKVTYETFDPSVVYDLALYKLGKFYRTREEAEAHAEEDKAYWDEVRKELEE